MSEAWIKAKEYVDSLGDYPEVVLKEELGRKNFRRVNLSLI